MGELREQLRAYLADVLGVAAVEVDEPRRAGEGQSRENWLFTATVAGEVLPLVLRRDPPAGLVETDREEESAILRALDGTGIPVPRVRWIERSGTPLGRPFMIMERSPGVADRRVLRVDRRDHDRSARVALARSLCDTLAAIHTLPSPAGAANHGAAAVVDDWDERLAHDGQRPEPVLRLAAWWLRVHCPPDPDRPRLVHGDYRPANVLVADGRITAVLDWELAHWGDPDEDVAWYLLNRYRRDHFVLPEWAPKDFLQRYAERAGRSVDPAPLRFWTVLSLFKSAVMARAAAAAFVAGQSDQAVASAEYFVRRLGEEVWPWNPPRTT